MTTSHNIRATELCKPEVGLCSWCEQELSRPHTFHCSDECRFWSKVNRGPECWVWTASCRKLGPKFIHGRARDEWYGQFTADVDGTRKMISAHRYSWQMAYGPIPEGGDIMHTCDNPKCVRPDHLLLGNQDLNNKDAAAKGHFHSARPTRQKLTPAQIYELRDLHRSGWTGVALSVHYGITESFVSILIRGKRRQYDAPLVVPREGAA